MPATGPSTTLVFCEGKPDSVLLNSLIVGSEAMVVSCGSKFGMASFIDGYLKTSTVGVAKPGVPPRFVGLRDRDFDAEPTDAPQLLPLQGGKPLFMTHRSCIESYPLEPSLIRDDWDASSRGPAWRHGPAVSKEEIDAWIRKAARSIADYQAVRWALSDLRPGHRWPAIRAGLTNEDGRLPPDLGFDACLREAVRLVEDFSAAVAPVSAAGLEESARVRREQFTSDSFYADRSWEVWFHGKDLCKAMQKLRPNTFSLDAFANKAASRIPLDAYPDLQQLRSEIRTWSSADPG